MSHLFPNVLSLMEMFFTKYQPIIKDYLRQNETKLLFEGFLRK